MVREPQLSMLVNMNDLDAVYKETCNIAYMMYDKYDVTFLDKVFRDTVKLYRGEQPGYKACNTKYHDLRHVMDVLIATARLLHGVHIAHEKIDRRMFDLTLSAALLHDTGYIQSIDDRNGTGGKYTMVHVERSIWFANNYFILNGFSKEDANDCKLMILGTDLDVKIPEIDFPSPGVDLCCKVLATTDLLGQMADRLYLEKLLLLFREFAEASVQGFESELDLLQKTIGFYKFVLKRMENDLDDVKRFMVHHFKTRWHVDEDMYQAAIDKNMDYLDFIMERHERDYRKKLKRGGIVQMLN